METETSPKNKQGSEALVPHTPDGPPPGPPGQPPPPPRYDTSVVIHSDSGAVQKFIEKMSKHPDVVEWEEESILVSTMKRLTISNTKLVSVGSFLGNMAFLTHLNLGFNRIAEISALAMCPKLVNVDISHNKILAIDSIRDLKDLRVLRCHHNHIESLEPIVELVHLEDLWVSHNSLQWTEFIHLLPQMKLRSIVKSNNPGNEKKLINEFIHAICPDLLYIDGVEIRHQFQHESAREFLRSTDGKIMFSQALSQLPAHTKKTLQESEGDKARLRTEYAGAPLAPDGHYRAHHLLDPKYQQHQQGQDSEGGGNSRTHTHPRKGKVTTLKQLKGGGGGGFRRGRKDLLHTGTDKGGAEAELADDHKDDHLSLRRALIAEASQADTRSPARHSRSPGRRGGPEGTEEDTDPSMQSHAAGGAGRKRPGLQQKSHLREVRSSGYGQQKGGAGAARVRHFKAKKNDYSTEYGDKGKAEQVVPREGPEGGDRNGHGHGRKKGTPPRHLVRHGMGAPDDPVALCLQRDGSGYARYASNNSYAVHVEASEHTGKHKLRAYYRSGSLAVTLDGDNNGSIMDSRGKCVCLMTSQGRGIAKILHPKTGAIVAQYTRPPDTRTKHGHEANAIDFGGEAGSAEGGSDSVLRASHSNVSLLTDAEEQEGPAATGDGESEGGDGDDDGSNGKVAAVVQSSTAAPHLVDGGRRTSKHLWKFESLGIHFTPSTWELTVGVDNDKVTAEFSNLHGGRLIKAKAKDEAAGADGDGASVDSARSHGSHGSALTQGSRHSHHSNLSQGSKDSHGQGTPAPQRQKNKQHRSDRALARLSEDMSKGGSPQQYLRSNMTERDHSQIRENVEEVMGNLDSLLGELKGRTPAVEDGKHKRKGRA